MKVFLFLLGIIVGLAISYIPYKKQKSNYGIVDFSINCQQDSVFEFGLINDNLYDSIIVVIKVE